MRHDLIVSQSVTINANKQRIWEALTNPEIIKEYLFGTETITDWKPGSEIIFQGEYEGHKYKDKGVILENIPFEKLSYSYWSSFSGLEEHPDNFSVVTYHIQAIDDNTSIFTWTQKGYANEERYNHSLEGMVEFLEDIKKIIESKND